MELLTGNCLDLLKLFDDNSVDSIVTDPPYGLSFMGKKWDYDVPSVEIWREVLRVLKPGGHLLSFGGTRTYHRMVVAIEDVGFEIRDQIQWLYGSGFPKSLDVSKAIDKAAGVKEWKETTPNPAARPGNGANETTSTGWAKPQRPPKPVVETDSAKQWQGWGTALKPANEPICLARKPLSEKTVALNVQRWGTGAINIDGCRVGSEIRTYSGGNKLMEERPWTEAQQDGERQKPQFTVSGRWPANLILDEEAAAMLDEQSGTSKSTSAKRHNKSGQSNSLSGEWTDHTTTGFDDMGGASRFFYCAKASKSERNAQSTVPWLIKSVGVLSCTHPTVKPIKLMAYLCRLITPPNGIILDPFMGSGSTGVAALQEGFDFIGIEMNEEYVAIAEKRINGSR